MMNSATPSKDKKTLMACHATAVLMERIARDVYTSKQSSEIQPLQWSILRYLERAPEDRREVRWIAKFLGLTKAPVSRATSTLEQRGLINITKSEEDSRLKTISLLPPGLDALESDPIEVVTAGIAALPESQREAFIRSVRTIALGARGKS